MKQETDKAYFVLIQSDLVIEKLRAVAIAMKGTYSSELHVTQTKIFFESKNQDKHFENKLNEVKMIHRCQEYLRMMMFEIFAEGISYFVGEKNTMQQKSVMAKH